MEPRIVLFQFFVLAILLANLVPLAAQSMTDPPAAPVKDNVPFVQIIPHFEIGTLAVLYHTYQAGAQGTDVNMITQGGQDILFPYQRYSVDLVLGGHNRFTFMYQPLTLGVSIER